jgi:hypothetical protein
MSLVVDFIGPHKEPQIKKVRSKSPVLFEGGRVTWRKDAEPGQTYKIPEKWRSRMVAGIPPEVRTTPREKFEALLQALIFDARTMFLRDGVVHWPASIKRELQAIGWKEGKPDMWKEVELLARRYVEITANKQRETDNKHVTTDWHGHYGA